MPQYWVRCGTLDGETWGGFDIRWRLLRGPDDPVGEPLHKVTEGPLTQEVLEQIRIDYTCDDLLKDVEAAREE